MSEGRPPSSCPWGQPSASSLKSGQLDCWTLLLNSSVRSSLWTMCHYMACCHIFRCYYKICHACKLFSCLWTWSPLLFVRIFLDKLPDKSGGCWGWKAEEGGRWWQLKAREGQHPSQKDDHCLMVKATCLREWLLVVKRFNNSSLSVAKNPDGDISATKELPEICWCPKN